MESLNRSRFVHLHIVDLDVPCISWGRCWNLLDAGEKSRADRFRSDALSRRWAIARAGLRSALASHCECSPSKIEFADGEFGKPELKGRIAQTGIKFNLSHSGNMAVVAVAHEIDIGIDIEHKKRINDWSSVAGRFFSPRENNQIRRLDQSRRLDAFYDCWTRKEALIKATGEGLSAQLDEFEVSISSGSRIAVLADHSDEQKYIGWRLDKVNIGTGFAGAVATPVRETSRILDHGIWRFSNA